MNNLFVQGTIVIFVWVGAWGIFELGVDNVAGDNQPLRFATYTVILLLGCLMLWLSTIAYGL